MKRKYRGQRGPDASKRRPKNQDVFKEFDGPSSQSECKRFSRTTRTAECVRMPTHKNLSFKRHESAKYPGTIHKGDQTLVIPGRAATQGKTESAELAVFKMPRSADPKEKEEALARLEHEATILAGLTEQGMKRIPAVVVDTDTSRRGVHRPLTVADAGGITMSYMAHSINKTSLMQTLSLKELLTFSYGTCKAMHDLHKCGVVHTDLSPNKVLFNREDLDGKQAVTLVGYGNARRVGTELGPWKRDEMVHVLRRAPEKASGNENEHLAEPSMDAYQVGLMIWQMLARRDDPPGAQLTDIVDGFRLCCAFRSNDSFQRFFQATCTKRWALSGSQADIKALREGDVGKVLLLCLQGLLQPNPEQRMTCKEALIHLHTLRYNSADLSITSLGAELGGPELWKPWRVSPRMALALMDQKFDIPHPTLSFPKVFLDQAGGAVQLKLPRVRMVFIDPSIGYGVFAAEDIPANTPTLIYAGEVLQTAMEEIQMKAGGPRQYSHMRTSMQHGVYTRSKDDYCLDGRLHGEL